MRGRYKKPGPFFICGVSQVDSGRNDLQISLDIEFNGAQR
jgi:hypothetical protein